MLIKPIGAFAGVCLLAACATDQSAIMSGFSENTAGGATTEITVVGSGMPGNTQCWKEPRPGSRLLVTRCATTSQRQADIDAARELTERMKKEQARKTPGRY